MKNIISVSRRTDIPAFYSDWFIKQISQGYCDVSNPYNPKQIKRISLKPEDVLCFVFWTRNPRPLFKHLSKLDSMGFFYYFLITLTGYPLVFEPYGIKQKNALENIYELSKKAGKEKIIWRYDPLILSHLTTEEWHIKNFSYLCENMSKYVSKIIVSIIEPYEKTKRRMFKKGIFFKENHSEYKNLLVSLNKIAKECNMELSYCSSLENYSSVGIPPSKCIDDKLIEKISGQKISYVKDKGQRHACLCHVSKDIGKNNSCLFGCEYCYATVSHAAALNKSKELK